MSVRSSSYDDLTDLESVKSGATSNFDNVSTDEVEDPKDLKIVQQEATIRRLTEENEKLKKEGRKDSTEQEDILTAINGSWQVVASIGTEEFLEKWNPSDLDNALFQVGWMHFQFDKNTEMLQMRETLGAKEHFSSESKLGERIGDDGGITYVSFVENGNRLVTVYLQNTGEEFVRVERFVKNAQLHLVLKRFAMNCTRIYEKIGTKSRDSGAAESGRMEELENELIRKDKEMQVLREQTNKVVEELRKELGDLEEKTDKLIEEMRAENVQAMDRLKQELDVKTEEVNTLTLRNQVLMGKNEQIPATITSEPIEKRILGGWTVQSDDDDVVPLYVPSELYFCMSNNTLVENNNGIGQTRYTFEVNKKKAIHNGRTRTFIGKDVIWSDAFHLSGELSTTVRRWIEGDTLKVTFMPSMQTFSYKRINV